MEYLLSSTPTVQPGDTLGFKAEGFQEVWLGLQAINHSVTDHLVPGDSLGLQDFLPSHPQGEGRFLRLFHGAATHRCCAVTIFVTTA